jgi:hypothetical protein
MAAKQSQMELLHEALAEMFIEDIRICREEGIPMSSADKMAIAKFLKDNSVTMDVTPEKRAALTEEFQDDLAARRAAAAAAILANAKDDDDDMAAIL